MESGFLLDGSSLIGPGRGRPLLWLEAAQLRLGVPVKPGDPGQIEVDALRCGRCGYLELYAGLGPER